MKKQLSFSYINQAGEKVIVNPSTKQVDFVSPQPIAFNLNGSKKQPEALSTELTVLSQIRKDESTLIWGVDDAEPIRILSAIAESPTATACLEKLQLYTRGDSFKDEDLMKMPIDKDGTTLWDLHCSITDYYCSLDGYAVNFKFDSEGKITNTYNMAVDGLRYVAQAEQTEVNSIKYNPYFGTDLYRKAFTEEYSLYNPDLLGDQLKEKGTKFTGQIYFHTTKRPLYKFYPVPKFWAGKKWIYSDAKLSTYIDTLLDNGFFSSVLMNVIGDPNRPSNHPDAMREETGTDGVKRKVSTKTEGEMFNKFMAENFSGVNKAAKAMVMWSMNKDQLVNLSAFPTTTNFDFVHGTLLDTIREVASSFQVPAILANLPDSTSPLSGQNSLYVAVDFMQTNTAPRRANLENFYNTILLPNLQKKTKSKVEIKPYKQAKVSVPVDKNIWEFMNEAEKIKFIEDNEPNVTIIRPQQSGENTASPTKDEKGNVIQMPTVPNVDEVLKGLKVSEILKITSIVKKVEKGILTFDQAKLLLSGYGLNDEQIKAFLTDNPDQSLQA